MTTIVVHPLTSEEQPSSEVVTLNVRVQDADWVGSFDQLTVWRSELAEGGPYEELTADQWSPARLPKDALDPPSTPPTVLDHALSGKTLTLLVNEHITVPITFTGGDPITTSGAAQQISVQGMGLVRSYVDPNGQLVVETSEPGTHARLKVLHSDSAVILALPTDSTSQGRDARISLVQGQSSYLFRDQAGSSGHFYKTRFRNRISAAVSNFSLPFGAAQQVALDAELLVLGYIDIISAEGLPFTSAKVSVSPISDMAVVGPDKVLLGRAEGSVAKRTDGNGRALFTLVRGQPYTLAVAGSTLVRDFLAPEDTDVQIFSMIDPDYSISDDFFKVRRDNIPFATRRSL